MYYCTSYPLAVSFCVLTMLCWGSWGNSQKLAGASWPYRFFYWDFVCGMLVFAAVFGLTLGSCGDEGAWNFLANLRQGSWGNIGSALLGGLIFNAALILLVKAIDMVGLAVAFPVCNGLSIALGTTVNYLVTPKGSPFWIFGGIALITLAVLANAWAGCRKSSSPSQLLNRSTSQHSAKGIAVAIVSGVFMSFFYSFVARTIDMDFTVSAPKAGMLTPYAAFFLFVVGTFLSTFVLNPVSPRKYFGGGKAHLAGFLGAAVWGVGTGISFVAAGPAGAAIAFGLGQGATLVSAIWGVFIWREFKGAPRVAVYLNIVFAVLFVCGLSALIRAGCANENTILEPRPAFEQNDYDWHGRHARILKEQMVMNPDVVLIGDSITHFWAGKKSIGGVDALPRWKKAFASLSVLNLGCGWDRLCNVAWRLDHGELEGLTPKVVVVHIGGNNFQVTEQYTGDKPKDVAAGVLSLVSRVHGIVPGARIVLMGIFPFGRTGDDVRRPKIEAANRLIEAGAKPLDYVTYINLWPKLLTPKGLYPEALSEDACHPSDAGYDVWFAALSPVIAEEINKKGERK